MSSFSLCALGCAGTGSSSVTITDFQVCVQLSDYGDSGGPETCTLPVSASQDWSDWAYDSNKYDPDAVRINVEPASTVIQLDHTDVRLWVQLEDARGQDNGLAQPTPWASEGGGWSLYAIDGNGYDFDGLRVKIETRPDPSLRVKDLQVGVQLRDEAGWDEGSPCFSKWLVLEGGGWSNWATDRLEGDPDAVRVCLNVRLSDPQPPSNSDCPPCPPGPPGPAGPQGPPGPPDPPVSLCAPLFFEPVGDLPGGDFLSSARDVSGHGDRVVGSSEYMASTSKHPEQAFGWTRCCSQTCFFPGIFPLGIPLAASVPESGANGISPDGRAVVGYCNEGISEPRPVLWEQSSCGMARALDRLSGHVLARAMDVSDQPPPSSGGFGLRVIVGYSSTANGHAHLTPGAVPVFWTNGSSAAAQPLEIPPGVTAASGEARGVADDGSVISGTLYDFAGGKQSACVWWFDTSAPKYAPLPLLDLPGGADSCHASGISGDGRTVVGWGTSATGQEPCLWQRAATDPPGTFGPAQALSMQVITDPTPGESGEALTASFDGSVVAGALVLGGAFTAVRWGPPSSGLAQTAMDYLLGNSIAVPPGWLLFYVSRLSADGKTMVGEGMNPSGAVEGWAAQGP